ncbi:MAG: CDGSH iron-sulfur domain-containing protein [Gammaproteobacteria bacterium]|nr:CDGSH iron-sulfur domain-containing protein [Gammaproteobacteria bacterium]
MARITVKANGPYLVDGVEIVDNDGRPFKTEAGKPVALCRCGQSAKKPFCDGTHVKVGFKSEERA